MDLSAQFNTIIITSADDVNFGGHVGEDAFHRFFKLAKDRWVADVLAINRLINVHFVTRKYGVEIKKEVFHPSVLYVHVPSVSFEGFRLTIHFTLKLQERICAQAEFELITVDLKERKMLSKSLLYEKYRSNHWHSV